MIMHRTKLSPSFVLKLLVSFTVFLQNQEKCKEKKRVTLDLMLCALLWISQQ